MANITRRRVFFVAKPVTPTIMQIASGQERLSATALKHFCPKIS